MEILRQLENSQNIEMFFDAINSANFGKLMSELNEFHVVSQLLSRSLGQHVPAATSIFIRV